MNSFRFLRSLLPVAWLSVAFLMLAGCATSAPHPTGKAAAPDPFSGAWAGTWKSDAGHHGKLECQFTKVDARHHRAEFTAHWLAFQKGYTVNFETERHGSELRFKGEQDLGALFGGVYRYSGSVTSKRFEARYTAASDHGLFSLQRRVP